MMPIRWRLWGPKLTDQQIHLATLGWKPEPGKSIPVNIIGGYKFPGAPAIKLRAIELEPEPIAPACPSCRLCPWCRMTLIRL